MKKFLFVVSLLLMAFSLFAQQEPLMKIYMEDGSTKQYNLKDIDSLGIIDNKNFYDMKIHYQDSLIAYYPTEIIGSIKFENDTNNNQVMNVYLFGYPKTYLLSSIDSIIFYKDIYQPLTIGSQVWMLKNLNVDHYRNGDSISEVRDSAEWANLTTGAWCYYNNNPENGKIYSKLYNWYAVNDNRGFAPTGWHIPSHEEWKILRDYLGGEIIAGNKIRDTGVVYWKCSNIDATNESGFSAFPGGHRQDISKFCNNGTAGIWWSSTVFNNKPMARNWGVECNSPCFFNNAQFDKNGFSVRCIKDK
jgi:uncharacterized protein (TIGR02145 family)